MKRTKPAFKKADKIITSDWHLQEGQIPICRTDDFEVKQWWKIRFISELQQLHNCDILHAGDLFDFWKPSPELLSKVHKNLPERFITTYGNHDLPQHNYDLRHKCGIYELEVSGRLQVFETCHWNQTPNKPSWQGQINENTHRKILVWHTEVYKNESPYKNDTVYSAKRLLKKYPQFDLIVTGDNHTPFVEEYKGRLLVNPGSIFRLTAAQEDHKPRVYLWYADTNTVEPVYIPIEEGVISREHIEIKQQRENRIDAFISGLNSDWEFSQSFETNLKKFESKNKIHPEVMEIILKSINME